jgi:hypothetical protein
VVAQVQERLAVVAPVVLELLQRLQRKKQEIKTKSQSYDSHKIYNSCGVKKIAAQ